MPEWHVALQSGRSFCYEVGIALSRANGQIPYNSQVLSHIDSAIVFESFSSTSAILSSTAGTNDGSFLLVLFLCGAGVR